MIGEDGFTYYTCKGECGQTKIAALFLPAQIADGSLVCRVCMGEISRRSNHGPRVWQRHEPEQRPRYTNNPVTPHYTRSVPMVFRRGGIPR
jgi:hypothetical protein